MAESFVQALTRDETGLLLDVMSRPQDSSELLAALRDADAKLAVALFAQLGSQDRSARYAAARALGALRNPEVTRRLVELVAIGERRAEALVALAASDEPAAIQFVSQVQRNAVLATALQSALVQAGTSQPWYGG
jgi:hypothetical protein